MKIALVSCAKEKKLGIFKAKELYNSGFFKLNYQYAEKVGDKIFILSAKHDLLDPEKEVAYYNETLNTKSDIEIRNWTMKVVLKLMKILTKGDEVIIIAGANYRKYLEPYLKSKGYLVTVPFKGLSMGYQMQKVKTLL